MSNLSKGVCRKKISMLLVTSQLIDELSVKAKLRETKVLHIWPLFHTNIPSFSLHTVCNTINWMEDFFLSNFE